MVDTSKLPSPACSWGITGQLRAVKPGWTVTHPED
ncbi:hypothetical protein C5L29_000573 [Lactiplantibacillus pentosus]|nr:hypothetical protein C5L29_000573 [Lactiplantibacillus pentosus]